MYALPHRGFEFEPIHMVMSNHGARTTRLDRIAMRGQDLRLLFLGSAVVAVCGASATSAETLADALIKAYQTSPLLDANEAALKSLDECAAQAPRERRPQLDVSGGASSRTPTERFKRD